MGHQYSNFLFETDGIIRGLMKDQSNMTDGGSVALASLYSDKPPLFPEDLATMNPSRSS